jgi:hypothetical protein
LRELVQLLEPDALGKRHHLENRFLCQRHLQKSRGCLRSRWNRTIQLIQLVPTVQNFLS